MIATSAARTMRLDRPRTSVVAAAIALVTLGLVPASLADPAAERDAGPDPIPSAVTVKAGAGVSDVPIKQIYHGQAVRLAEALARRGIRCGPEMDGQIVLETPTGRLLPLLADWRGRAFYQDERLRNRRVTLVAHRRDDVGYLQPLMIFTYDDAGRPQFTDYWCDVCSIPMYEIKACECCQGDIRIRYTPQPPPADVSEALP